MPDSIVVSTLRHLACMGVREFCVAAGARNAAIIAALQASRGVRLWSFFEERCAGFFALGRMLHDSAPVAVVTTSGTAVAELLPAVIEAYYQGLPLVVLSADRPSRYRGTGAPQSIEQSGIFGEYARPAVDLEAGHHRSESAIPRPVRQPLHLNLCLEEGLPADLDGIDFDAESRPSAAGAIAALDSAQAEGLRAELDEFVRHDDLLVLAAGLHPRQTGAVWDFLAKLGAPILAEATANLRGHPHALAGGESALRDVKVGRVLRIGGVPSGRFWRDLEDRPGIPVMNLTATGWPGLARRENVRTLPLSLVLSAPSLSLAGNWRPQAADPTSRPSEREPLDEAGCMRLLARSIPGGACVFLGNSLPIREFNEVSHLLPRDTFCYANRGANGIDGLVSTFLGLSVASAESWAILGDLSALYDLAGPWILSQLPPGNRRIVVINNGGGKIFARVPSLKALPEPTRAIIENRHHLSFAPWAELWGIPYRRATRRDDLFDLPAGPLLIEVVPST